VYDYSSAYGGEFNTRRGKRRFDDDEPTTAKRVRQRRAPPSIAEFDATDGLPEGDRWSTWARQKIWLPTLESAGQGTHVVPRVWLYPATLL
jgi:hypothetical protein